MGTKIAVIGGGSTYTPELVDGLARRTDRPHVRFPVAGDDVLDLAPSFSGQRRITG